MATVNIGKMTDEAKAAAAAAVAAANAKNGKTASGTDAGSKLNADFNFFLKMLTTQLQHQDPSEPMDTSQMTQQIATFSGVEQQVQTNSRLDQLLASNQQSQLGTAVSYIGREVETEGNTGSVIGGQGAFSYVLPEEAKTVSVVITNAAGKAVFSGAGTATKGRNTVVWDGKNSITGAQEPDGTYTVQVTAKNAAGVAITPDIRAVGIVEGVETDENGSVVLTVGDIKVKYDEILAVRAPSRVAVEDPADTGSGTGSGSGSGSGTGTGSGSGTGDTGTTT